MEPKQVCFGHFCSENQHKTSLKHRGRKGGYIYNKYRRADFGLRAVGADGTYKGISHSLPASEVQNMPHKIEKKCYLCNKYVRHLPPYTLLQTHLQLL